MNLIDLLTRGDPTMSAPTGTRHDRFNWGGATWCSIVFPIGKQRPIRLSDFAVTHPAWSQPDTLGWYALCRSGNIKLEISIEQDGEVLSRAILRAADSPVPVRIPWPTGAGPLGPKAELVLRVVRYEPAQTGGLLQRLRGAEPPAIPEAELLIHRVLQRSVLYDLAKGKGVEIGPGPKPQILPGPDVDVTYIEEMPRERWIELYDPKGKFGAAEADWSRIQTGKAAELPSDPASLDFVFSSHVFEHLANPLGHLEHWKSKLKPGGHVLMIVPEISATKDRFMRPTRAKEILREYDATLWEPQWYHYKRHATRLNGRKSDRLKAKELMDRQESIHVHYYDRATMAELMGLAVERLGYTGFRLIWAANHKDFYIVLSN